MLSAYLDESFDPGNQGAFAVGGLIHDGWGWLQAEDRWVELCERTQVKRFKASELASKNVSCYREFAKVIRGSGAAAFGVAIPQDMFITTFTRSQRGRQFRNTPYFLAYQHLFIEIAKKMVETRSPSTVSFVCDRTLTHEPIASEVFEAMRRKNPGCAGKLGSFSMRDDAECAPLQMADLIAYELRLAARAHMGITRVRGPAHTLLEKNVFWKGEIYDQASLDEISKLELSDPDLVG